MPIDPGSTCALPLDGTLDEHVIEDIHLALFAGMRRELQSRGGAEPYTYSPGEYLRDVLDAGQRHGLTEERSLALKLDAERLLHDQLAGDAFHPVEAYTWFERLFLATRASVRL